MKAFRSIVAIFLSSIAVSIVGRLLFVVVQWSSAMKLNLSTFVKLFVRGLYLDISVAGYITALPLLLLIFGLWGGWLIRESVWRWILRGYLSTIATLIALIAGVDANLYRYWGYRVDATLIPFLSSPSEAAASITFIDFVIAMTVFLIVAGMGVALYWRAVSRFSIPKIKIPQRVYATLALLLCGGLLFLGIRGGVSRAVANVSKVYFSENQFANHAAVNPAFSLLSSMTKVERFSEMYNYYDTEALDTLIDGYRAEGVGESTKSLLRVEQPNILFIICESYTRSIMDMSIDGREVMPRLNEIASEGVLFENMYANGARTDRGVAAVLSGFPTQPKVSVMKMPGKSRNLPSVASALDSLGYGAHFLYGGDLNFMDMSSYLYSTGWDRLVWNNSIKSPNEAVRSWGYSDGVVGDLVAEEFIALSKGDDPLLMGWLTLSFHEPFDVPADMGIEDVKLNAAAYSDAKVGELIDKIKSSEVWDNTLIIIVADHTLSYPRGLDNRSPLRYRIPMIWSGGALSSEVRGYVETKFMSQIDIAATLLAQMGLSSEKFLFSRNIYAPNYEGVGYYTFSEGFGVVSSDGATIEDMTAGKTFTSKHKSSSLKESTPKDTERKELGRALLQSTHRVIDGL